MGALSMIVRFEFRLLCMLGPRTLHMCNGLERQFSVDELDVCICKKYGDTRRPILCNVLRRSYLLCAAEFACYFLFLQ